jgi:hypothetical protein
MEGMIRGAVVPPRTLRAARVFCVILLLAGAAYGRSNFRSYYLAL